MVRNFIDVLGITPEDELPRHIKGQLIEYSEAEYLFIPENKPRVRNIFQIMLQLEIKSNRVINAPFAKLIVIDGIKKIKIIYTEKGELNKANILNLEIPYNTFMELPKDVKDIEEINVYIADAFFAPFDGRKIYSHMLYVVYAQYSNKEKSIEVKGLSDFSEDLFKEEENIITIPIKNQIKTIEEMLITGESNKDTENTGYKVKKVKVPNTLIDIDEEYL